MTSGATPKSARCVLWANGRPPSKLLPSSSCSLQAAPPPSPAKPSISMVVGSCIGKHRLPEPLDIFAYAGFDFDGRLIGEQPAGFGQVGMSEGHVFGSRGMMLDDGFCAGGRFDQLDQAADGDGVIVAK